GDAMIRTSDGIRLQMSRLSPLAARAPLRERCRRIDAWSRWSESNRRPADYKSAALPPELHRQAAPCSCGRAVSLSKVNSGNPGRARPEDTRPPRNPGRVGLERDEANTDNIRPSDCQQKRR